MKKLSLCAVVVLAGSLLASCGAPSGSNAPASNSNGNKAATNAAVPASDPAAAEAEVNKLMDATQAALSKNDADAMDKIYADNYMTINHDGSVQNKAERLGFIRSGEIKYETFSYADRKVRVAGGGDDAIAISTLNIKGTFKGKPMDGSFRVTGFYTRTKDGWKLLGSQSTKIEGGSEPGKTEDKPTANANGTAANK